jgi:serine/threonine protein kinase
MAVAVMRSLIELQDRVGVHHCDVKPENVLFSILNVPLKTSIDHDNISHMLQKGVKELFDVKYSFVLTDFGNAVIRPERIGKIYGTRGYTCPIFSQGNREQHLKDHMGLGVTLPDGNHVDKQTHRTIWKSYSWLMEDASKLYDRLPVKQCYAKNDLYALGVTLLRFDYHEENHPLAIFGWLLVSGARDAIWSLHEAYKVLKTVRKSKLDRDVEYITYEQAERRGMDPHYYGP